MDLIESIFGHYGAPAKDVAKKFALKHIDSGFYRLTAPQAKALCVDGKLPRIGYEKRAKAAKELNELATLFVWNWRASFPEWRERPAGPISERAQTWIKRTRLSHHDGKAVPAGWVWALHVWEPI
jgi:hypothetical protein